MTVMIVGAGPSGLTLACDLAAAGVEVRIVDGAEGPAATSRANILHARGVEVLRRAGALGDLAEHGLAPVGMRMHARGRALATMRFAPDPDESVQALFISQAVIEARLRQRLTELGIAVEWGTELTSLRDEGDAVSVRLGDTPARVDWLIGCDGAHSTVRQAAGIDFPGVAVVERFLLADVHARWDLSRETSAGWFHADGIVLAMPMRDERGDLWRLMADVPAERGRLNPDDIVRRLTRLLAERADVTDIEVRDTVWTSVFRVQRRLAENYRRGRVLLAGDAAHVHSPIGGQGMNTGIGDAENIAWKLAMVQNGLADERLLDSYDAERRPLARDVLRDTTTNTRLLVGQSAPARMMRDHVLVPLLNNPAVQRRAGKVASQLWVDYHRGPLGGRGPKPRPGDRVPDRGCRREDGTAVNLHDTLGAGWAVLSHPDNAGVDQIVTVARRYLGEPAVLRDDSCPRDVLVVRPDGHLGWRGTDPAALDQWCAKTLRGGADDG